jgi:hypothetical protein
MLYRLNRPIGVSNFGLQDMSKKEIEKEYSCDRYGRRYPKSILTKDKDGHYYADRKKMK